jgi:anti-anti-sigma factor
VHRGTVGGEMVQVRVDEDVMPGRRGLTIRITGEFDFASTLELRCELLRLVQLAGVDVAVNLAGVSFIDCAALGLLVEVWGCADTHGHGMSVTDLRSPAVGRVLDVLRPTLPFAVHGGQHDR